MRVLHFIITLNEFYAMFQYVDHAHIDCPLFVCAIETL